MVCEFVNKKKVYQQNIQPWTKEDNSTQTFELPNKIQFNVLFKVHKIAKWRQSLPISAHKHLDFICRLCRYRIVMI